MEPKHVFWTLIILNLVFFGVFYLLSQTRIFDHWITGKVLPNLCVEEQDGQPTFTYCAEQPTED